MMIKRVFGEDGKPVGYEAAAGVSLLGNANHAAAYAELPSRFRFKDAKKAYGKGDSATVNFLQSCESAGILRNLGRGEYEKTAEIVSGDDLILQAA